jgi:transposase
VSDPDDGTPLRTGDILPEIGAGPNGELYIVWQEATLAPSGSPIAFAKPIDGGATWSDRRRPRTLIADRGYDHDKYRRLIWKRGVKPIIARRQIEHGSGLGRHRWVVERTFAWLHNRRRLLISTNRPATPTKLSSHSSAASSAGSSWRTHRARAATSVADLRNSGRLELRTNSRASALDVEAGVLIVAHQSARDCDRLWLS